MLTKKLWQLVFSSNRHNLLLHIIDIVSRNLMVKISSKAILDGIVSHVSEVRVVEILQVFRTFWSGLRRFGNLKNTTKRER